MIGVEIVKDKRTKEHAEELVNEIRKHALQKGLILLEAGKSVIRLCPPLTITKEEVVQAMHILEDAIKQSI